MADSAAAEAALDLLVVRMMEASAAAVMEGALSIEAKAKVLAPVETGHLRRSINTRGPIPVGSAAFMAEVGPTTVYGRLRELGGHIYPKTGSWLRWPNRKGFARHDGTVPEFWYAKHVYQRPQPYLKPAASATDFKDIAIRKWRDAILSV